MYREGQRDDLVNARLTPPALSFFALFLLQATLRRRKLHLQPNFSFKENGFFSFKLVTRSDVRLCDVIYFAVL